MDFKFLEIGTRIAIGQFDATIIEYDVLDGFSGLFPVYVVRFDTGETEPVHHTDITGLIYDNPMPIEVIEARKAYRAEHGDDAPDPLEEIEIEHAEMGDAEDYDQLRIERGEFETENYQLKQQLAAVTADLETARCTQEELQSLATAQNSRIEYLETQLGFISGLLNPEVTNIQVAREIMEEIREVAREVFTTTPDEQIQRIEVLKQNAAALDESILAAVTAERDALKTQMAQIAKMARLFIQKERDHKNSEYLWHEGLLAILTMTGE